MMALPLSRTSWLGPVLAAMLLMSGCATAGNDAVRPENYPPMEQCTIKQQAVKNATVKIELARDGATGFQWFAEAPSGALRLLDEGQVVATDKATGAPVTQWWTFQVGDEKTATVEFFLYRTWEGKNHAIKHCVAEVTIK